MASFDRERNEVVLRVVYDGAATAGKTANLRALQASFGLRARIGRSLSPAETVSGRTLFLDALELEVGGLDEWPLRCQVLSVPGQFAFAERRYRILRDVDAVVLVCESTPRGLRAARVESAFLGRVLASTGRSALPVIVQENKQDLPAALAPMAVDAALGHPRWGRATAANAAVGDGVRATFLAALDAARERVRAQVRRDGALAFSEAFERVETLYASLVSASYGAGDGRGSEGYEEALEAALASVGDGASDDGL